MDFLDILLWISLIILVVGAFLPKKYGFKVAASGWVLFGLRWLLALPGFFFVEHNIMYSVACLPALPVTLYMALLMVRDQRESLMVVTRAAAIGSIFYFPFANIPVLGNGLISITANIALAILHALGQPAILQGLDQIILNGQDYEILLACTAVQSMALFVGVIGCTGAPPAKKASFLLAMLPLIYVLNMARIVFIAVSDGNFWFASFPNIIGGPAEQNSFFWAHNVFAEAGTLMALAMLSYVVIKLFPDTLVYTKDLFILVKPENVAKNLRGEKVEAPESLPRKVQ